MAQSDVPRSAFDKDLLFSFGAVMTICAIRRHDAEKRVRAMVASGFKASSTSAVPHLATEDDDPQALDLERLSKDQIATLIGRKFRGHEMARLVDTRVHPLHITTWSRCGRAGVFSLTLPPRELAHLKKCSVL